MGLFRYKRDFLNIVCAFFADENKMLQNVLLAQKWTQMAGSCLRFRITAIAGDVKPIFCLIYSTLSASLITTTILGHMQKDLQMLIMCDNVLIAV